MTRQAKRSATQCATEIACVRVGRVGRVGTWEEAVPAPAKKKGGLSPSLWSLAKTSVLEVLPLC